MMHLIYRVKSKVQLRCRFTVMKRMFIMLECTMIVPQSMRKIKNIAQSGSRGLIEVLNSTYHLFCDAIKSIAYYISIHHYLERITPSNKL